MEIQFSKRDIETLQESFTQIAGQIPEIVHRFYALLFEKYPNVRNIFPANMEDQESKFMQMLGYLVTSFENYEELRSVIAALGQRHKEYQVDPAFYPVTLSCLLEAVQTCADEPLNAHQADVWTRFYQIIAQEMILAYRK